MRRRADEFEDCILLHWDNVVPDTMDQVIGALRDLGAGSMSPLQCDYPELPSGAPWWDCRPPHEGTLDAMQSLLQRPNLQDDVQNQREKHELEVSALQQEELDAEKKAEENLRAHLQLLQDSLTRMGAEHHSFTRYDPVQRTLAEQFLLEHDMLLQMAGQTIETMCTDGLDYFQILDSMPTRERRALQHRELIDSLMMDRYCSVKRRRLC